MKNNLKIGFIGAGKMGGAIIFGLIKSGFVRKENIIASEKDPESAKKSAETLGIKVITDNNELVKFCDVIFLATKPFIIKNVLTGIKNELDKTKLIVSIAAGVTTNTIEEIIGEIPIIRAMPNTPALVSEGMSVICAGKHADDDQLALVKEIFSKTGKCTILSEKLMDSATGINGSGPAFVYTFIEALADGGVKIGIPKEIAIELAAQTVLGASKMVLESGKHPSLLKDEVTTPGGCTAEGLAIMEENNIRSAMIKTVEKTAKKASELG